MQLAAQWRFLPWTNVITALKRGLRANSPSANALGACWHCPVVSWPSFPNKGAPGPPARWIIFHKNLLNWIREHWSCIGNILLVQMLPPENTLQRFKATSSNQGCINHSQLKYHCSHLPDTEWKHKALPTHTPSLHPPSFMSQLYLSLLCQLFTSSPSQGITLSLCSSCKTVAFLWSMPCGYPLILIPALSFKYVSASTLLKCCQPFTVLSSRRKADP